MTEKKPYSQPQLFRVELSQEQAILSACSLTATNPMAGGMDIRCRAGLQEGAVPVSAIAPCDLPKGDDLVDSKKPTAIRNSSASS